MTKKELILEIEPEEPEFIQECGGDIIDDDEPEWEPEPPEEADTIYCYEK